MLDARRKLGPQLGASKDPQSHGHSWLTREGAPMIPPGASRNDTHSVRDFRDHDNRFSIEFRQWDP